MNDNDNKEKIKEGREKLKEFFELVKEGLEASNIERQYMFGRTETFENKYITGRNKQPKKSYYKNYERFWKRVGITLGCMISFSIILGFIGYFTYRFIRFDIAFYRGTQISLSVLISSILFCGFTLWYIVYYFYILIPEWLKNLDKERGIKFNEN